nr:MAG TPA: dextransucrase [Caudoviricetes sp.]
MYLVALDDHTEGFARWWFRGISCLSAFLVGFGLIMAVTGR